MLLKRPQHKQFEYLPRYYNPDKDPELKRREKYRFRSNVRRGKRPSFPRLLLMLVAVVLLYFMLIG